MGVRGGRMSYLAWLVPIALGMGVVGLIAFLWSMKSGQYDDMDGAAERVLLADMSEGPLRSEERVQQETQTLRRRYSGSNVYDNRHTRS
jgi:cbb3-type cytochrome oxidase maturation protein